MEHKQPTIKGIFVNSHIKTVRNKKGEKGIKQLEKLYGHPLDFKNSDNVLVKEEVRLIECAVKVLHNNKIADDQIPYEAGRLHFKNFSKTPFGQIVFSMFKSNLKLLLMQSQNIASHVFQGVEFESFDMGDNSVKIVMHNNDYPLDHFKGLFQEWIDFSEKTGDVHAEKLKNGAYQYLIHWD